MCADLQILPPDPTHTTPYPFQTLTYIPYSTLLPKGLAPLLDIPDHARFCGEGGGEKLSGQIHPSDP